MASQQREDEKRRAGSSICHGKLTEWYKMFNVKAIYGCLYIIVLFGSLALLLDHKTCPLSKPLIPYVFV